MKILVTGGAGFLGSFLCDKLISQGHTVLCLDDLSTGSIDNIRHLLHSSQFDIVNHDVMVPFYTNVDAIYNLACPASPVHYQKDPIKTVQTCVMGAINMLDLADKLGVPILQASTSEVYGDPVEHPQTESYWGNVNPIGIRSCYDEGKRCAETLFFDYHRGRGVDIRVMRIFNTYGPRMQLNDGRVVSNFIVQALRGEPITIYGNGQQTRSFCYVDDLIDGMVRMMNSGQTGPVNLGNPQEHTMIELARAVIELAHSASEIVFRPLPLDDPQRRNPDISLAQRTLNWRPVCDLKTGLANTINYFATKV
jgi:UDP-glucuronate decarboxylase